MVYQSDNTASGGPQTGFWYYTGRTSTVGIGTSTITPGEMLDVVGSTRTSEVHTPGTFYSNMLAVAYGQVGTSSIVSTSGNYTFARMGIGTYVITLTTASGLSLSNLDIYVFVANTYGLPGFVSFTGGVGAINVKVFDTAGAPVDRKFSFAFFKP